MSPTVAKTEQEAEKRKKNQLISSPYLLIAWSVLLLPYQFENLTLSTTTSL
jgi:hypothetical protein